jgi:hypothetical protein
MFLSFPLLANQLNINDAYISYLSKINIEVNNTDHEDSTLKVTLPNMDVKTVTVIAGNVKKIIEYTPSAIGKYIFSFSGETESVWVLKKPNVELSISKVFVTNVPVHLGIPKRYQRNTYDYSWHIYLNGSEILVNTESTLSFTPTIRGEYSLKLEVSDNRLPIKNSQSITTMYRVFTVKDRTDSFRMNLPKVIYEKDLPLKLNVFKPFNNEYQIQWFVGDNPTPFDNLTLTKDMFKDNSLNVLARVINGEEIIGQKYSHVNLEDRELRTGRISLKNLPSGNVEISSNGAGILSINDADIMRRSLVVTDNYIVINPIPNHPYKVLLLDGQEVLDSYEVNNTIEHFQFDFDIDILTADNVTPAFVKFTINNINIPESKIDNISFIFNEEVIHHKGFTASGYSDLLGTNTSRIEIRLKTNEMIIKAKKFTLNSSTLPTCSIEYESDISEIWTRCTDTDSFIEIYSYSLLDKEVSKKSSLVLPDEYQEETITFEAVDALGNKSSYLFKIIDGKVVHVQ